MPLLWRSIVQRLRVGACDGTDRGGDGATDTDNGVRNLAASDILPLLMFRAPTTVNWPALAGTPLMRPVEVSVEGNPVGLFRQRDGRPWLAIWGSAPDILVAP